MKVYPASRVLIFSKRQVEKKLIEMTIEPMELRIPISPHFKAVTKIDLCYVKNVPLYCK